jgi:hypothetical protein
VSLFADENSQRVSVRDFDHLAEQIVTMNSATTGEQHAYEHFSPFRGAADDTSCRTCAHSVGLIDGHHLFCQPEDCLGLPVHAVGTRCRVRLVIHRMGASDGWEELLEARRHGFSC